MSPLLTTLLTAAGGVLAGVAVMTVPLLRLRRIARVARFEAGQDDTTGLPNRRAMLTALHEAIVTDRPFGLILLDLDGFKTVNDTYGHETGNDLLTVVGQRLASLPDPMRLAARLSGDEFAVLVHGGPDEVGITAYAAAAAIEAEPIALDGGRKLTVNVSVGYTVGRVGVASRSLLREADEAMYHAKTHAVGVSRYHPTSAATVMAPTGNASGRRCRDRR